MRSNRKNKRNLYDEEIKYVCVPDDYRILANLSRNNVLTIKLYLYRWRQDNPRKYQLYSREYRLDDYEQDEITRRFINRKIRDFCIYLTNNRSHEADIKVKKVYEDLTSVKTSLGLKVWRRKIKKTKKP